MCLAISRYWLGHAVSAAGKEDTEAYSVRGATNLTAVPGCEKCAGAGLALENPQDAVRGTHERRRRVHEPLQQVAGAGHKLLGSLYAGQCCPFTITACIKSVHKCRPCSQGMMLSLDMQAEPCDIIACKAIILANGERYMSTFADRVAAQSAGHRSGLSGEVKPIDTHYCVVLYSTSMAPLAAPSLGP
jgi:hypothetical protein